MLGFIFPVFTEDINPLDTGNFEDAVLHLLGIEGPDIDVVVRKGERFDNAVPDLSGIGGSVVLQDDLLLLVHCVPDGLDAACIGLRALELIDARDVVNGGQFLVE